MKGRAFTLIELLVVVLIIGILSAIALPQYQRAVIKSRLATIKPILASLKNAEEAYYLENGTYTDDFNALSVQIPCEVNTRDTSLAACGQDWMIDLLSSSVADLTPAHSVVLAYYCPGEATGSCIANRIVYLTYWLEHSSYPGTLRCSADDASGDKICQTENR